jgi:hypothetical protein
MNGLRPEATRQTRSTTLPKESAPATHPQKRRRTDGEESISGSKNAAPEQPPPRQGDDSPPSLRNLKRPREDGQGFDPDATAVNRSQAHNTENAPSSPTSSEGSSGAHAQHVHPQGDPHTETPDMQKDPHRPDSTSQENGGPVHPHLNEPSADERKEKTNMIIRLAAVTLGAGWLGYLAGGVE